MPLTLAGGACRSPRSSGTSARRSATTRAEPACRASCNGVLAGAPGRPPLGFRAGCARRAAPNGPVRRADASPSGRKRPDVSRGRSGAIPTCLDERKNARRGPLETPGWSVGRSAGHPDMSAWPRGRRVYVRTFRAGLEGALLRTCGRFRMAPERPRDPSRRSGTLEQAPRDPSGRLRARKMRRIRALLRRRGRSAARRGSRSAGAGRRCARRRTRCRG